MQYSTVFEYRHVGEQGLDADRQIGDAAFKSAEGRRAQRRLKLQKRSRVCNNDLVVHVLFQNLKFHGYAREPRRLRGGQSSQLEVVIECGDKWAVGCRVTDANAAASKGIRIDGTRGAACYTIPEEARVADAVAAPSL